MLLTGAHLRLGQLLMDVGLVSQEGISEAVKIAGQCRLPIGRALVMNGSLSEPLLQAALQAQSLYRDGLITRQETVRALESMKTRGLEFDQAVEQLKRTASFAAPSDDELADAATTNSTADGSGTRKRRLTPPTSTRLSRALSKGKPRNRLGELLVAAEIMTSQEIDRQLERSTSSGLPLGRYLVSVGAVSDSLIMAALNIQMLIRSWKMTREQGIEALKSAKLRQSDAGSATLDLPAGVHMHLGELLVMAEIISAQDMMHSVEVSLINDEKLGQTLLRFDLVQNEILQEALVLQQMLIVGRIGPEQAVRAMTMVFNQGVSGNEAAKVVTASETNVPNPISFETLLRLTGIVSRHDLDEIAFEIVDPIEDPNQFARLLVSKGHMSEPFLRDCQRIHSLVVNGCLTAERAVVILKHCLSFSKNVRQSLDELGWTLSPAVIQPNPDLKKQPEE